MAKLMSRGELLVDLVEVSKALGDDSETLTLLKHHITAQLDELLASLDDGYPDLQALDESQFFAAIQTLNDADDAASARTLIQKLEAISDSADIDPSDKFKLRHITVKAILIGGSQEELAQGYRSLINSAQNTLSKEEVHQLRVEYASELLKRDLKTDYIAEVRRNMDDITPGYRDRVGLSDSVKGLQKTSLSALPSRIANRLRRRATSTHSQDPDIDRQINEANILQAEGQNEDAFEQHMALAQRGVSASQMSIGTYYQLGIGCAEDHAAARKWYGLAAEQGNVIAHLYLGALLQMGFGGPADIVKAVTHYRIAAENGNAQAFMNLSSTLASVGYLDKPDLAAAMECIFQAWEIDNNIDLATTLNYYSRPLNILK